MHDRGDGPVAVRPGFPSTNNFDLIRLIAATQVVIEHAVHHLGLRFPMHDIVMGVIASFPGVPVFFVVSGFLIAASCARSPSVGEYAINRLLRIYPALWGCLVVSVVLIFASGYWPRALPGAGGLVAWVVAQASIVQFYNPGFLRAFGDGVVNGSLWTIPVELQFYVLTPLLIWALARARGLFWALMLVSIVVNGLHTAQLDTRLFGETGHKLAAVTFLPWIYMFMVGALLSLNWARVERFFVSRFAAWFAVFAVVVVVGMFVPLGNRGNAVSMPFALLIAGVTLSAAFTRPDLASRLLRRNDISYGIYIYHMPIFNLVIQLGYRGAFGATILAIVSVFGAAILSWKLIEKPALTLKRRTLLRRDGKTVVDGSAS